MALNRNTAGAQKTEYSLVEITKLGRTLKKRAADVLAYFDRPGTSNGPTEAICECLPGWSGTGWSGWFRSR